MKRIFALAATALSIPALAQNQPVAVGTTPGSMAYRKFKDEPVAAWREANDTVGRIGGWKVYARERLPAETRQSAPVASTAKGEARK